MEKKCESYMDRFFALDKNERLPLSLTLHLLACKKCRSSVRRLTLLEKKCSRENLRKIKADSKSVAGIMSLLDGECRRCNISRKSVSLTHWSFTGILLLLCMIVMELLAIVTASELMMFSISFFFGFSVIVYCAFFVGLNMDFFIKKWKIE